MYKSRVCEGEDAPVLTPPAFSGNAPITLHYFHPFISGPSARLSGLNKCSTNPLHCRRIILNWGWIQPVDGVVMLPLPANHDEVFSLHADAPGRGLFRWQTHSHCCLNAARLHPAAAPGPLRVPCPGQDPSLRGPCVLQTPPVLCGNRRCCRRRTQEGRRRQVRHA